MTKYTAVVIGAGPAGHTSAVRLAQLGAKVAVVERDYVGGICTNWGCTPSKSMIEAAKIARTVKESAKYGIHVADIKIDFKEVAARRDEVIVQAREEVTELLLRYGVDIYQGEASVVSPGKVLIRAGKLDLDGYQMHYGGEETTIEAEHIVLATGSQPLVPNFVRADNPFVVSSNRLISIGQLPAHLTIVGGGVIGVEFATIFSNLGSRVTIVETLDRILAGLDAEVSEELTRLMTKNGVRVLTNHHVTGVETAAGGALGVVKATERRTDKTVEIESDAVLIAIGRKPVIEQAMFDRLGIAYNEQGICVDEYLRTNVPGVWAIGDATGKSILAHVGMQQGIVAAENIMKSPDETLRRMDYSVIPAVVYSIPEVVFIGEVPLDVTGTASRAGAPLDATDVGVYKVPFAYNLRAKIEGYSDGFIKVWIRDQQVVAAQAIGHGVSEIMQELANMIALKTPVAAVADIIHAHPTYSEIVRAALAYSRGQATDFWQG